MGLHFRFLALAALLGGSQAMYTVTSVNDTSLDGGAIAGRGFYFGGTDGLLSARLDAMDSGNSTTDALGDLARRDVWSPKITNPGPNTVWVAGAEATVTWDTSDPPQDITNTDGKILLGHVDDGVDEHLDVDHPLAQNFDIRQGSVNIKVPYVAPGNDYIIVLMGDSGNKSPTFTIN